MADDKTKPTKSKRVIGSRKGRPPYLVALRNNTADAAVIFIHGFSGHPRVSWGAFPDALAAHLESSEWDLFSLAYSSTLSLDLVGIWSADPDLSRLATYLHTAFDQPPLDRYQRLALIAHSMGGLVVQRALLDHDDLLGRVRQVFLFATPSAGLTKATWIDRFKRQWRDLRPDSGFIRRLRSEWEQKFGATLPFELVAIAGDRDEFAPAASCFAPFPASCCAVVPGTHVEIVKPTSTAELSVQLVLKRLAAATAPAGPPSDAMKVPSYLTLAPVAFEPPRGRRLVLLVSTAALVAMAAGGAWYLRSGRVAQIDSIAVLPFTNGGGDANTDYLSDGITESLINNLAHVPQLRVKSRQLVFRYKGKDVDLQKVGNDLGVSALVNGRVVPRGDSIEVSADVTDVRDNTEIWGQHYSGKSADIISLQEKIAGDIAAKLRSGLNSSEKQQVTKQGTQNPEAYELYLKGRYSLNKRTPSDLRAAISYFNQAIAKDPGYALAYSGLADAYSVLPDYGGTPSEDSPKSNAAARKALELDATLARPHAVLGGNEMEYDWDFAGGEAEYKKALELDPDDATAHQWYGVDLAGIGGREQEALAEINRAHQLDPLSPVISKQLGDVHISARRYDEAIAVCKKLANENPAFAQSHLCLALGYWGKRMYPQVIEEWKAYGQLFDDRNESEFASALEQGFRSAGWKGALTKGIETRQAQRKNGYMSAYDIAGLHAESGDKDQAFRWLNTAYQERDGGMVGLKTDFLLDPLRSDPRFAELVRKVGLPQ